MITAIHDDCTPVVTYEGMQRVAYTLISEPVFLQATNPSSIVRGYTFASQATIIQPGMICVFPVKALARIVSRAFTRILRLTNSMQVSRFRLFLATDFIKLYWQIVTKYLKGL